MAHFKGRYWLIFNKETASRPLIYEMSKKFDVIFNIRQSSVTGDMGLIALELEGERQIIKDVIAWFESQGVQVDPAELQTIEG
ncbi:MAG: NIL domain-containing protein [Verrucomicrobiia bacterium]